MAGAAGAGVVALLAVGVGAMASIPDSAGLINGCFNTSTGALRVIDSTTQRCRSNETALSWSQAGQQGPQGMQGAPGATGATGADGATGATGAAGATGPTGAQGPKGDPGATGSAGTPGAPGAQGVPGLPGVPGLAGADGGAGPQGIPGPPGAPGPDNTTAGATGATGATGPQGPAGTSGYSLVLGPLLLLCTFPTPFGSGCDLFGPTFGVSVATCPSGTKIVGGGYSMIGDVFVLESAPDSSSKIFPGLPPVEGWTVAANTNIPSLAIGYAQAYAICTNAS